MSQFKVGEVVQLKSGGPLMTVHDDMNRGNSLCCWFIGETLKRDVLFPDGALVRVVDATAERIREAQLTRAESSNP